MSRRSISRWTPRSRTRSCATTSRARWRPSRTSRPSSTTRRSAAGTCASRATRATPPRSTSTSTSARCATRCTSCRRRPSPRAELYEFLLKRNHTMYGARFSLGPDGDIYLVGRLGLEHLTEEELDRIIGVLYELTERWFQTVVAARVRARAPAADARPHVTRGRVRRLLPYAVPDGVRWAGVRGAGASPFGEVRIGAIVPRAPVTLPACNWHFSAAAAWARHSRSGSSTRVGTRSRSSSRRWTPTGATSSRRGCPACGWSRARRGRRPIPTSWSWP